MALCGGMKGAEVATAEIQGFIDKVREEAEKEVGRSFEKYEAKVYATQLVNGVNYFVKVNTGSNYVHMRLYKPFQGDVSFVTFQDNKTESDELAYF
ncbi:cystatin-A2-like [Antedon mediterranea]|uniref:cystatin-A2-like n=1 Tax=Antedon mediterranea TaxID=105859 RepID=UPI003AF7FF7E